MRSENIKTRGNIIDWLGDRQKYMVTVSGVAGEAWEHDQVGIRISHRIAGTCVLENAMRCLNQIP